MKSGLNYLTDKFYQLLESILVFCMVVMFILIFTNVMLRFLVNDSVDIAEELPRFLFIWMTFVGAVLALKEGTHISVNIVVSRLSSSGKKFCYVACQILIFICGCYMLYGTWLQHDILLYNLSPVMMISMLYAYGISYMAGFMISLLSCINLVRFFSGKLSVDELYPTLHEIDAFIEKKPEQSGNQDKTS